MKGKLQLLGLVRQTKLIDRAMEAYFHRCNKEGWIYQQPSGTRSNLYRHTGDDRLFIVLANSNGPLAVYRVVEDASGNDHLRWQNRWPAGTRELAV